MTRTCGDCRACCYPLGIPELKKPCYEWCKHVGPKGSPGCTIYEQRPEPCKTYQCYWLADPTFPEEYRPDKAGFIVDFSSQSIKGKPVIYMREVRRGAMDTVLAMRVGKALMTAFVVLVQTPTKMVVANPDLKDVIVVDEYVIRESPRRICCGAKVVDTQFRGQPLVIEPFDDGSYRLHPRSQTCTPSPTRTSPST